MSGQVQRVARPGLVAFLMCLLAPLCPAAQVQVREMLQGAGVKGGLVVHLGAADGELASDLAGEGTYLVHGLAIDEGAGTALAGRS